MRRATRPVVAPMDEDDVLIFAAGTALYNRKRNIQIISEDEIKRPKLPGGPYPIAMRENVFLTIVWRANDATIRNARTIRNVRNEENLLIAPVLGLVWNI